MPQVDEDRFDGYDPDEVKFLEDLEKFFKGKSEAIAERFEVTYKISSEFANVDPATQAMKPTRRGSSPVFNLIVGNREQIKNEVAQAALAAGGADPCCWWVWNGQQFVCVAFCD